MNASALAGVTVVAASSAVCGAGLLLRRSARLTGALLVVVAALLLVPVVADVAVAGVWLFAAVAVATAAFVVYPAPSLRSAVDLLAVALTVAAAVVVLLTAAIPDQQQAGTMRWASAITAVLVLALHTWWRLESAEPRAGAPCSGWPSPRPWPRWSAWWSSSSPRTLSGDW